MNIYLAAPLFNEMERSQNRRFTDFLEKENQKVYLPQRDGGLFYDYVKEGYSIMDARKHIFNKDIKAIHNSDIILCLLDGRVLDEGMCIELGIAFEKEKICIGFKTDERCQDKYGNNIMLDGVVSKIFNNKIELIGYLNKIKMNNFSVEQITDVNAIL